MRHVSTPPMLSHNGYATARLVGEQGSPCRETIASIPLIYAIWLRREGILKIGHTRAFKNRMNAYVDREILAVKLNQTRQDEAALHRSLAQYCVRGNEYYEPSDEILNLINEWRADAHMKPLDRFPETLAA